MQRSGRLGRSLAPEKKAILDEPSQGYLDGMNEDLLAVINDTLSSKELHGAFRGISDASTVVEIVDLKLNLDYSQALVFWESSVIAKFTKAVAAERGPAASTQLARTMEKTMSTKLQKVRGEVFCYTCISISCNDDEEFYTSEHLLGS